MAKAYIGIGANIGDRLGGIRRGIAAMDRLRGTSVARVSSLYDTAPVGVEDQPRFLNGVVELETMLGPHELLRELQRVERRMGRIRLIRWGPRVLDLDVLIYEDAVVDTEDLKVPHPLMVERAFVLVPLAEIAPDLLVPGTNCSVKELLSRLEDEPGAVRRVGPAPTG